MLTKIIAALWESSIPPEEIPVDTIFLLTGNIMEIGNVTKKFIKAGKKVYVDIDFVAGLNPDRYGIRFLKNLGVTGVITAKMHTYRLSNEAGISAILRFFALDSRAVEKGIEQIIRNRVNAVEILPGIAACKVAKKLRAVERNITIVAAGLVDNEIEVRKLLDCVDAISTSKKELWNYK
ncbi:glycerol-3-phosphate responsive antiterminator GlpP [Kosmotoga arenicorallina S304]|uniref:Glycerol-3-phosphate responsive antiterminator GlpP n=1 Tax=Kosmotoga arenicorallina S304 TaxID=1453497 RepID=A0A176K296_9BACT|nr:glycerol-3-phosphate responsive antiterminator [Kosmotoga arenicorallina]OAA31188.1 glycerol-3-phosphate responsive antiterminator GlpP [Kosmotoga arenicorallina S304]